MSIPRLFSFTVFVLFLLTACEVEVQDHSPAALPQPVRDAWADVFQERKITSYDLTTSGDDTTYTLYSGYTFDDGTSLEFYVKKEGDADHDSYQMTVTDLGVVENIREETVLAESEFPDTLLTIVRDEFPENKLVGMRRILENEKLSYAVNVVQQDTDEMIEVVHLRYSPEGKVLERETRSSDKKARVGVTISN